MRRKSGKQIECRKLCINSNKNMFTSKKNCDNIMQCELRAHTQ